MTGVASARRFRAVPLVAGLVLLAARGATADEGWVTHDVCVSPALDVIARGRMHAEKGTAWLITTDATRDAELHRVPASGPIRDFSFSADGSRLATTGDAGSIRLYETRDLRVVREIGGHDGWVVAVALSPDGKTVASGGVDGAIRVRDADTGDEIWVARFDRSIAALLFLPDGKSLVAAEHQGSLRLCAPGRESVVIAEDARLIEQLDLSPDGARVASVHRNGELRLWDLRERKLLWKASVWDEPVYDVSFSADGKRVAVCGALPGVRIFDAANGTLAGALKTDRAMIAVRFGRDRLVAADGEGVARRWKRTEGGWQPDGAAPGDEADATPRDG